MNEHNLTAAAKPAMTKADYLRSQYAEYLRYGGDCSYEVWHARYADDYGWYEEPATPVTITPLDPVVVALLKDGSDKRAELRTTHAERIGKGRADRHPTAMDDFLLDQERGK